MKAKNFKLEPKILNTGGILAPFYGINPRTIKGNSWWNKERQKAYASTDYHCIACGVHKSKAKYHQWLEAHELFKYDYKRFIITLDRIIPLCHACHNFIHIGRAFAYANPERFKEILLHGFSVLKKAKLTCKSDNLKFARTTNVPTFGLKILKSHYHKLTKRQQNDWYKKCLKAGGWKLMFEGNIYQGKTLEQIENEYAK